MIPSAPAKYHNCKTVPGTIFLPTEKRKLRKGRGEPIFQGGQFIHVNIHSGD